MVHSSFTKIHLYKGMNSCSVRPIKSEDPLPDYEAPFALHEKSQNCQNEAILWLSFHAFRFFQGLAFFKESKRGLFSTEIALLNNVFHQLADEKKNFHHSLCSKTGKKR